MRLPLSVKPFQLFALEVILKVKILYFVFLFFCFGQTRTVTLE